MSATADALSDHLPACLLRLHGLTSPHLSKAVGLNVLGNRHSGQPFRHRC